MKSDDPQVDGVERDHDRDETGGGDQRRTPPAPGAKTVRGQEDRVDDPGDGGPRLLRAPTPPPPPPGPPQMAPAMVPKVQMGNPSRMARKVNRSSVSSEGRRAAIAEPCNHDFTLTLRFLTR